jgi:hypothetical protein
MQCTYSKADLRFDILQYLCENKIAPDAVLHLAIQTGKFGFLIPQKVLHFLLFFHQFMERKNLTFHSLFLPLPKKPKNLASETETLKIGQKMDEKLCLFIEKTLTRRIKSYVSPKALKLSDRRLDKSSENPQI